ncbi:hypothetical protein BKA56DRAFT_587154 [Ilyonectria sp. MPI-CAGE-AT-0026]|nr:hypothetical protein BKA56DRAFT_587154 [Ilyonectria sp. MPI-CAGE-AT-0026]
MTKGNGLRQYRACVRCRSRKTRCDLQSLGEPGKPPCSKCVREGAECILAGSRRGGDFSHLRRGQQQRKRLRQDTTPSTSSTDHISPRQARTIEEPVHDNLQNPYDALLILAHTAGQSSDSTHPEGTAGASNRQGHIDNIDVSSGLRMTSPTIGLSVANSHSLGRELSQMNVTKITVYPLIDNGIIDPALLIQLLHLYAEKYHPFCPIVPGTVLRPDQISDTIENESFLLTSVLVVASKDRRDLVDLHKSIWTYMRQLILDVVLGMTSIRNVGCVEGLLLLGEWTLLNQGHTDDGGEGAAWSILGLAVRLAYLLRLEDSSFKGGDGEVDTSIQRERLAWTFTYLSDRQISIRMGQAFWCRGPALSARFTANDFPALQPRHSYDEDFASLIQAQVELTTLFGNAHDILFASRSRTAEIMMRGDYTKYVDDTSKAMYAWKHAWTSLAVSPHLKSCLTLMQEYLRLYVNAFAFQAVIYRASSKSSSNSDSNDKDNPRTALVFPDSTMASPDARSIYEAINAAETLITIVVEDIDPVKHLRYMPARFYLYEIHSSVFLYKAHASGAISSGQYAQTASLMQRFTSALKLAAVDENHVASRYAKLLDRLWFRRPETTLAAAGRPENMNLEITNPGMSDSLPMLGLDINRTQLTVFDDIGLQPFDCTDTMDGLFAIPPVFPWDQCGFLNTAT